MARISDIFLFAAHYFLHSRQWKQGIIKNVISQHKMNLHDIIFLMMYIFVLVYLFIFKMPMTSSFVCTTLNLGRKKSTRTEPKPFRHSLL